MKSYTHHVLPKIILNPRGKRRRVVENRNEEDAVFNSANTRVSIAPKNETLKSEREKEREIGEFIVQRRRKKHYANLIRKLFAG